MNTQWWIFSVESSARLTWWEYTSTCFVTNSLKLFLFITYLGKVTGICPEVENLIRNVYLEKCKNPIVSNYWYPDKYSKTIIVKNESWPNILRILLRRGRGKVSLSNFQYLLLHFPNPHVSCDMCHVLHRQKYCNCEIIIPLFLLTQISEIM